MKLHGITSIVLIIAFSFLTNSAQIPAPEWSRFSSPLEEFELETPEPMQPKLGGNEPLKPLKLRGYRLKKDDNYFFAFSVFPNHETEASRRENGTELVSVFVGGYGQKPVTAKLGSFETEKYSFLDADGFHHIVLIVRGESRNYFFQTVTSSPNHPDALRFHKSIQLIGTISPGDPIEIATNGDSKTSKSLNVDVATGGYWSDNSRGSGSGNGETAIVKKPPATDVPSPSPKTPSNAKGIMILSKPRANYTDFARFYEIEGKLVLRATFLADGTIGAVSVLQKLPFGLTGTAVAAVRGVRFTPAEKDGVPYSVSKNVEYSFIIL